MNLGIQELKDDGTLQTLQDQWLTTDVDVPVFSYAADAPRNGVSPVSYAGPTGTPGDRTRSRPASRAVAGSRILGNRDGGREASGSPSLSTIVFFAIVVVVVVNSPGWSSPGGVKDLSSTSDLRRFLAEVLDGFVST